MKQSIFEKEILAHSLSLENSGARIICDRKALPQVRWFAASGEMLWSSSDINSFLKLEFFANRSSGLFKNQHASISTVEHLSPVLLLYPQFYLEIHALAEELPILDGSAYPWYEAIRNLAGVPQELAFYNAPIRERLEWEGGFFEISPAETLEIEYSISHGNFSDDAFVSIYDAEDLVKIFPARTFIFEDDLKNARANGLLAFADARSGMLLAEKKEKALPKAGGPLRMPNEPVMHKILDLVGDISLPAPFLPRLRIRIHNGGHVAHRKLLERLMDYAFRNASQV